MRDIEIKTLRLFVAVCDHQNMARAAEQAHIEPSAISKRMTQLEADLGTPLIARSRRGVQPTAAGPAVLEHARQVLFTMEQIASEAAAFGAGVKGSVRLVATASAIAAARAGRTVRYRVIVSNFDAAFRVVAARLAVSVLPMQVGGPYATMLGVKLVPLADAWAARSFVVCFRDVDALSPASRELVAHLVARAAEAQTP